jgi:peroxiredoxin
MRAVVNRLARYAAVLPVLFVLVSLARAETGNTPKEGDRVPAFSFKTDNGKTITPTTFGGKLVVLNFWETACVPCIKELPSLSAFARAFAPQVVVIAISADSDATKYQRFLRDHRVTLETCRDPSGRISKSFGTYMFPETYLIQDGRIVRKIVGAIDWTSDDIVSFVRSRLAGR